MLAKYFAFLAVLVGCIAGYLFWPQSRKSTTTPNLNVNEEAFYLLKKEMTPDQVAAVLESPHETAKGRIIKIERPEDPQSRFGIQETNQSDNPLRVFRGVNDESIRALFSLGKLIAAEFCLGHTAVLYNGDTSDISDRDCLAADRAGINASPLDDQSKELRLRIEAFRKKQALRNATKQRTTRQGIAGRCRGIAARCRIAGEAIDPRIGF